MATLEERLAAAKAAMSMQPPSVSGSQAMSGNRDQQRQAVNTSGSAFGQAFANRMAGNVANIPDVLANIGARGVNAIVGNVPDIMQPDFYRSLQQDVQGQLPQDAMPQPREPLIPVPAIGQEFVPGPTGSDLLGLVQRGGELAGAIRTGDFGRFQPNASEQQRLRTEAMAQQNPSATMLGNISGDMMTLMTARAPIAAARSQQNLASAMRFPLVGPKPSIELAPNVATALRQATANSKGLNTLMNRAGRAAETGLEGFTLAALNGQADPLETAAFAAGTQAAGSLLLSGMSGLLSGGPTRAGAKLAISAAAMGSIIQLFKSATPGGDDYILQSIESGFNKVALGLAAGVVAGGAGMGRVTKGFPVNALPNAADIITSLPRAATLSVITSMLNDPAAESVVNKISTNPTYFDSSALRRIERSFIDPEINLSTTIDDLMQNREFRQKFEAIGQ
jgi:hypothetical protein